MRLSSSILATLGWLFGTATIAMILAGCMSVTTVGPKTSAQMEPMITHANIMLAKAELQEVEVEPDGSTKYRVVKPDSTSGIWALMWRAIAGDLLDFGSQAISETTN